MSSDQWDRVVAVVSVVGLVVYFLFFILGE
jgi:hypothetical protein